MRRLDARRLVIAGITIGMGSALLIITAAEGSDRLGTFIIAAGVAQFTLAIDARTATWKPPRIASARGPERPVRGLATEPGILLPFEM